MKTFLLIATYLVGVGELVLALYFWMTRSGNTIRKVMALLAFSTGVWVLLSVFIAYKEPSNLVLVVNQLVYVFGILLVTALVHLAILFPIPIVRFDRLHAVLLYLPALIFSAISVSSGALVSDTVGSQIVVGYPVGGPVFPIYNAFLALLFLTGIAIMFLQMKRTDGFMRRNISFIAWSFVLGGLPAVYIDLFGTTFHLMSPNYLIGNLATIIWLGTTMYIVSKK